MTLLAETHFFKCPSADWVICMVVVKNPMGAIVQEACYDQGHKFELSALAGLLDFISEKVCIGSCTHEISDETMEDISNASSDFLVENLRSYWV